MKFNIHIMPPDGFHLRPQATSSTDTAIVGPTATAPVPPTSSSRSSQRNPANGAHMPLRILAMPADPDSTFAELTRKTESRIRERYAHEEWARMPLDTVRDSNGGDIFPDDKICSLYRADTPSHELQLHMYLKETELQRESPQISNKRRHSEEVQAAEHSTKPSKSRKTTSRKNAFAVLQSSQNSAERKQRAQFSKHLWTEEEDRILIQGVKAGLASNKILGMLPRPSIRSASGLRGRKAKLGIETPCNVVSASQTSTKPHSSAPGNRGTQDSKKQAGTLSPSSSSRRCRILPSPSLARETSPQPDPEIVPAAEIVTEQPNVTVSPPKPRLARGGRTDVQRWQEAKERAGGDRTQARRYFAEGINREAMLDAVMRQDTEEVDRLKAERRRMAREQAAEDERPLPKRSAPFAGLAAMPNDNIESHDEEVIREDDWSTDSGEARNNGAASDEDELDLGDDAGDDGSEDLSDQVSSAVPDHDFGASRIAELEDSPLPPLVPDSKEAPAAATTLPELVRLASHISGTSVQSGSSDLGKKTRRARRHRRVSGHSIPQEPRVEVAAGLAAAPSKATTELENELQVPQRRSTRQQENAAKGDDVRMPPPSVPASSQKLPTNGNTPITPCKASTKYRIAMPVIQTEVHMRLTAEEKLERDMAELKRKENLYLADDDDDEMSSSSSSDSDYD